MATVFQAWDMNLQRPVAVKLVRSTGSLNESEQQRFLREARMLAQLHHPNVVAVHDVGLAEGRPYLIMELLTGQTLRERLRGGALPLEEALRITHVVASALGAAHQADILHLDVKPENIIFDQANEPKLSDFGISRAMGDSFTETQGQIMGTAAYMSPELLSGAPLDRRADVYGLGVVLYEMLTGQKPFSGETAIAQATQRLLAEPAPPHAFNPVIPRGLSQIVLRALARDPEERFPSARALSDALHEYEGNAAQYTTVIPRPEQPLPVVPPAASAPLPQRDADEDDAAEAALPQRPARSRSLPLLLGVFLLGGLLSGLLFLALTRADGPGESATVPTLAPVGFGTVVATEAGALLPPASVTPPVPSPTVEPASAPALGPKPSPPPLQP